MTKLNLKSGLLFATRLALAAVFAVIFFGVFITPANATTSYPVGSNPTGVAFDNVTNSMWVTNMGSHTISKLDINTGTRTDYPVGDNPLGVAFDNVTNSVWVANQLSSTVSKV
ncbi:MAG: hypothetical protein Q7S50_04955, partial [bacterium]|nr:hypothetical protein [bacterium]